MGDSREASPDWLRSFQAPTQFITTLSSDSEPSSDKSPARDDNDTKHKTSNLLEDGEDDENIGNISLKSHTKKSPKKKSPIKKTTRKRLKAGDETTAKRIKPQKRGSEDDENVKREEISDKSTEIPATAPNHSVCELSSDSESNLDAAMKDKEDNDDDGDDDSAIISTVIGKSTKKEKEKEKEEDDDDDDDDDAAPISTVIGKSTKKQMKQDDVQPTEKRTNEPVKMKAEVGDMDVTEENKIEKQTETAVNSSTLPLILPEKVHRSKALVECEGESIDLSGDMGAVGRVIVSETSSKESEMFLDLKGTIYKTVIVPSRTFCVVSIGQSEAKIEAIMNDFIQLKPQSNVYDAETMVEGTLEGFNFDSDEEPDKMTKDGKGDQNEEGEEKPKKKTKGKVDKKPAATKKKGKDVGGKQPKKRKPQAPKKGKSKK